MDDHKHARETGVLTGPVRAARYCDRTAVRSRKAIRAGDGSRPWVDACGLSMIESRGGRQVIALDVDVVRTPSDEPVQHRC